MPAKHSMHSSSTSFPLFTDVVRPLTYIWYYLPHRILHPPSKFRLIDAWLFLLLLLLLLCSTIISDDEGFCPFDRELSFLPSFEKGSPSSSFFFLHIRLKFACIWSSPKRGGGGGGRTVIPASQLKGTAISYYLPTYLLLFFFLPWLLDCFFWSPISLCNALQNKLLRQKTFIKFVNPKGRY